MTTAERGYGAEHQAERQRYQRRMNHGEVFLCARCRRRPLITADTPWDLGHTDDRTTWTGPEHVSCNRAAGARTSNTGRRSRRKALRW